MSLIFWFLLTLENRRNSPSSFYILLRGNGTCIIRSCFPTKRRYVLRWPFWWVISTSWQIFSVYDLPLKSNNIPDGIFNEVSEWPLILNQCEYSEWVVCVCWARLWVFPIASLHILKRNDSEILWESSCRVENSRMGMVEWWTWAILCAQYPFNSKSRNRGIVIHSFTYSFFSVQQIFWALMALCHVLSREEWETHG